MSENDFNLFVVHGIGKCTAGSLHNQRGDPNSTTNALFHGLTFGVLSQKSTFS